jgi:hypothetical protein
MPSGERHCQTSEIRTEAHIALNLQGAHALLAGVRFFVNHKDENVGALLDFLSERPDILDEVDTAGAGMLSAGHKGYLTLATSYMGDETADLKGASRDIIARGLATGVVMGHTHEAVNPNDNLAYANTGSWTRYYVEKPARGKVVEPTQGISH